MNNVMVDPVNHTVTIPLPAYMEFTKEQTDFMMYSFKIKMCPLVSPHDWSDCLYAHRGERARRRDPRKFLYSATACAEWKGRDSCPRGKNCPFAHGVYECWLHPTRYRTRMCDMGLLCTRRICFFAHSRQQLRVVASVYDCSETNNASAVGPRRNRNTSSVDEQPERAVVGPAPHRDKGKEPATVADPVLKFSWSSEEIEDTLSENAKMAAMLSHTFAAPLVGGGRYTPLFPLMAGPSDPEEAVIEFNEHDDRPTLDWVRDLLE